MTNENLKIAILVATFNGEKYLSQQIFSILSQKNVSVDLYLSDDASTDTTKQLIESFINKNLNIKLINHKRIGGPAKNFYYLIKEINVTQYEYIALCDQDDIWPEYRLSRAIKVLKNNNVDCYSSDVIAFDNKSFFKKIIKKSQKQKRYDYIFETPGPGCSFVFTKKFCKFLQTQLYGDVLNFPYHDWLIYALARQNNFKWMIDDAPNLFYRQHNQNFMGANYGFYSRLRRLNRILFGEYYKELIQLYEIINKKKLNFITVWYFVINFNQTRRKFRHALLMIPFLMIVSMQKNDS